MFGRLHQLPGDKGVSYPMDNASGMEYKIGDRASLRRTVTETDIVNFAGVSGDFNPVHIDEEYAKNTIFKSRIAHGLLSAAFIGSVLANKLPGPGGIYLKQELSFLAPVRIGDTVTAEVEIMEINEKRGNMWLKTVCRNQEGTTVVEGKALLKYKNKQT